MDLPTPKKRSYKKADANDELVWLVCGYIKCDDCKRCAREIDLGERGRGQQMCRALAVEVIAYVQENSVTN